MKDQEESIIKYIWRVLYIILIYYAVEFAVEMGFAFELTMAAGHELPPAELTQMIRQNTIYIMLVRALIMIPLFLYFMHRDRARDLLHGRNLKYSHMNMGWMIMMPFFGMVIALGFNHLIDLVHLEALSPSYQSATSVTYQAPAWLIPVAQILGAPILEELMFRGLVYRRIRSRLTPLASAILSSAIFGLVHGNLVQFVYAFVVGILFSYIYEKTKTIWASVLAHVGANGISYIINLLFPNMVINLPVFILISVAELVVVGVVVWVMHKKLHRIPIES